MLQLFLIDDKHRLLPILALFVCLLMPFPSFGPQLTGIVAYVLCDEQILSFMDDWGL
jgi:hypothetical protein